jgi:hypothetical protein
VCPSCGAKRAVKFAEHIHSEFIEDIPHRHTVFTIAKRLRVFFRYDRKLNTILAEGKLERIGDVVYLDVERLESLDRMLVERPHSAAPYSC